MASLGLPHLSHRRRSRSGHHFLRWSGPLLVIACFHRTNSSGITFRYVGSDQHSALNILDSICTISHCRATEGLLSGIVILWTRLGRPTLIDNEISHNRESGIFSFAGAQPYLRAKLLFCQSSFWNCREGPEGTRPEMVKNNCRGNMLSGILLFHFAKALVPLEYREENAHWGSRAHSGL